MNRNPVLEGPIFSSLIRLALPIMGTAFVQMAYNMTDMIWLGHAGSREVAASGTAGFYMWLGMAFILVSKIGTEIGVAQAVGRRDTESARRFAGNALQLNILLSVAYGAALVLFKEPLIAFFRLGDPYVVEGALQYLAIIGAGMPFAFINPVFTAIYNGYGISRTPFSINAVGLAINIVLDPLLIFGIGPIPALGVVGAAIATVFSQFIVTVVFYRLVLLKGEPIQGIRLGALPEASVMRTIAGYGLPAALQSGMFTLFAMLIARLIAQWGPLPIAVQKVGAQIEAISWMTASGFSTALGTFVGQNYGAGQWDRIARGYLAAIALISGIGLAATALLVGMGEPIFALFIPEREAILQGGVYLRILGYSQLFMCIEITTTGAFNGLGRTVPPSVNSILLTGARVPAAMFLAAPELLGLEGIWWSISVSSILKGVVLSLVFLHLVSRLPELRRAFSRVVTQL